MFLGQHCAKAPALDEVRLRHVESLVIAAPMAPFLQAHSAVRHPKPVKPDGPPDPTCCRLNRRYQIARQKARWVHSSAPALPSPGPSHSTHTVWSPASRTWASSGGTLSATIVTHMPRNQPTAGRTTQAMHESVRQRLHLRTHQCLMRMIIPSAGQG